MVAHHTGDGVRDLRLLLPCSVHDEEIWRIIGKRDVGDERAVRRPLRLGVANAGVLHFSERLRLPVQVYKEYLLLPFVGLAGDVGLVHLEDHRPAVRRYVDGVVEVEVKKGVGALRVGIGHDGLIGGRLRRRTCDPRG